MAARTTPILSNFTWGELSPLTAARVDQAFYFNGCRTLENMFVWRVGPASRRPGTRFIVQAKYSNKRVRLIPFEYSTEQAYVIEAGDQYFRFFKDRGRIESPPGTPVEVATPWLEADLAKLKWCQSADVLYLFCPGYQPRKLSRTSHTAWTLIKVDFLDGPYLEENPTTASTLAPSAITGTITVTAAGAGNAPFAASDVGRAIRIKHGTTWGWCKITGYSSPTQVTALVSTNFGAATAQPAWRLGLWSDTTGWPVAGTFHEERLMLGGAKIRPQRVDGSVSNDYERFAPGTNDSDALAYNIGANQVCAIRWMESWRQLLIGTPGGEFKMGSENSQAGLTPTNPLVSRESNNGSADIMPLVIGNALLFVQRQGRKLREVAYDLSADGYIATDLTLFAEHMSRSGFTEMVWQQEPAAVLWCIRADGLLVGCTYMRDQKVLAWHRHPSACACQVGSIACIPGAVTDELWLATTRTIAGVTQRWIESMEPPFDADAALKDAWFVDAGLDWTGAPATVFSGLGHLEGEQVAILADGAPHPPRTVAGGTITLDRPAARVIAGLGYVSTLESMPLEIGQATDTAQARKRRVDRVMVRLRRTLGCEIGVRSDVLLTVPFRSAGDAMDQPPPLFSGDKTVGVVGGFEDVTVFVRQAQPLPLTVLGIAPRITAYD